MIKEQELPASEFPGNVGMAERAMIVAKALDEGHKVFAREIARAILFAFWTPYSNILEFAANPAYDIQIDREVKPRVCYQRVGGKNSASAYRLGFEKKPMQRDCEKYGGYLVEMQEVLDDE